MASKTINVAIKEPGKNIELLEIENTLQACQQIVDGYIEVLNINNKILLICNEEGKFNDLKRNFSIPGDIIFGTVFFCRAEEDSFSSILDEDIDFIKQITLRSYS
ncbi:MAG: DUF3846 domain-containing protein [Peptococcaceae bacterium]|nr:DUF3846 domain-containing protein [Peptococcaceae bacterium]